jgi:hypothetical protein
VDNVILLTLKGGMFMKKQFLIIYILSFSVFIFTSCARVQEPVKGDLKTIELKTLDAIPAYYGSLISVTANPEYSRWAQLWFEDDDGIIRVVSVGFFDQKIMNTVTEIPRN